MKLYADNHRDGDKIGPTSSEWCLVNVSLDNGRYVPEINGIVQKEARTMLEAIARVLG